LALALRKANSQQGLQIEFDSLQPWTNGIGLFFDISKTVDLFGMGLILRLECGDKFFSIAQQHIPMRIQIRY
jgi:hypothetical protein